MAVIQIVDNEIAEKIQRKYGNNKIKQMLKMYQCNIPERYWLTTDEAFDKDEHRIMASVEKCILHGKWAVLAGKTGKVTQMICYILKRTTQSYFLDFFDIMSKPSLQFDQSSLNSVIHELAFAEVIGIAGIKYGTHYNTVDEIFQVFLGSLMNTQFTKNLIIGVEKWPDNKMGEYYGALAELVEGEPLFELFTMVDKP